MKTQSSCRRFSPLLGALLLAACLTGPAPTAQAALPEPYNLLYGVIEMDGHFVTVAETNVTVEARRLPTGATIARYVMGSQASASNFYALKIRLESPAPDDIMKAAETGTTLYITVLRNGLVKNQLEYDMGDRGKVMRLDFGNIDTDGDGLPDGWEQAYLFGLQFGAGDDPDRDGSSNADEYRLGTHPFRPDARHPADLDQNWRITIPELSAYYSAWRRGQPWTISPTNIPLEYVTRGTYLWEQGEAYHQDIIVSTTAPLWWLPGAPSTNSTRPDMGPPPGSSILAVTTFARAYYEAGQLVTVTNRIEVLGSLRTYAVQQSPPPGWEVVAVAGGVLDSTNNLAKWGPYFDRVGRDVVLTLRAPADAHGVIALNGAASYDGFRVGLLGVTALADLDTLPSLIQLVAGAAPRRWVLQAPPLQTFEIQGTEDLRQWLPIWTNHTDAYGLMDLPDQTGLPAPMRFYRARLLP